MIAVGSDHAGYLLKTKIVEFLKEQGYEVKDYGTFGKNSVDYPDYGKTVAEAVKNRECSKGIIICGTGIGISMSANKVPGIRAALCTSSTMAKLSREHNNANVLAIGERIVGESVAVDIVDVWLNTDFLGGRHERRVNKIHDIEKKYFN